MTNIFAFASWPIWTAMTGAWVLLAAYIVDRCIGDPRWIPHPVIGMGKGITALERWIVLRFIRIKGSKRPDYGSRS